MERDELAAPLTPEQVRRICDYHFGVGSDGILEVVSADGDRAEVVIWNPDGSTAELSGNGTRIAARWLARGSGAQEVRITVGSREVVARMGAGAEVELDLGAVEVGETETIAVEGATWQMMNGNGYGFNWKGLYVTSLIDAHASWRSRACWAAPPAPTC